MNMMRIDSISNQMVSEQSYSVKPKSNTEQENTNDQKIAEEAKLNLPKEEVNFEVIKKEVENFNRVFKPTHLEFQLHEASGKYFVHIIDDLKKEIIKQIPSEDFLEMVARSKDQNGLLVDELV
jgi:flagellar protein FlaG